MVGVLGGEDIFLTLIEKHTERIVISSCQTERTLKFKDLKALHNLTGANLGNTGSSKKQAVDESKAGVYSGAWKVGGEHLCEAWESRMGQCCSMVTE